MSEVQVQLNENQLDAIDNGLRLLQQSYNFRLSRAARGPRNRDRLIRRIQNVQDLQHYLADARGGANDH